MMDLLSSAYMLQTTKSQPQQQRSLPLHFRQSSTKLIEEMLQAKYIFLKLLAIGGSGKVYVVMDNFTGIKYACKVVYQSGINDKTTMDSEVAIMKNTMHENIIQLVELYESNDCLWFILELADTSLSTIIESLRASPESFKSDNRYQDEQNSAMLFQQVLEGVKYLHQNNIIHRDLKADNILLMSDEESLQDGVRVKIADFGLSSIVNHKSENNKLKWNNKTYNSLTQRWGTMDNFAPEVFNRAYGPQADVWSLGCLLFMMLTGEKAFTHASHSFHNKGHVKAGMSYLKRRVFKIPKQHEFMKRKVWNMISPQAQDLITRMLDVNPYTRYNIQECLNHPWIVHHNSASIEKSSITSTILSSSGSDVSSSSNIPSLDSSSLSGKIAVPTPKLSEKQSTSFISLPACKRCPWAQRAAAAANAKKCVPCKSC